MKKYTLREVVDLLPYEVLYNVMVLHKRANTVHYFHGMSWGEMRLMLTRRWWSENARISNSAMGDEGHMILHLEVI